VREFREQIAWFLESDTPVAVTRRGETLGVYVPTPRKPVRSADQAELRAAADRLAAVLSDEDEEEIVAEFRKARRAGKAAARRNDRSGRQHPDPCRPGKARPAAT